MSVVQLRRGKKEIKQPVFKYTPNGNESAPTLKSMLVTVIN